MNIANKSDYNLKKEFLIDSYSFIQAPENGYMLLAADSKILFANAFLQKSFSLPVNYQRLNSLKLFQKLNKEATELINKKIYDRQVILDMNNHMIVKIHEVVTTQLLSVQFVFFAVYQREFMSLLIHFVPVVYNNAIQFIQVFTSNYDLWGIARDNTTSLFNGDTRLETNEYLRIMNRKNNPISTNLTARQEEIVFLLAHGIGLRQTAKTLMLSYGSLYNTIRNLILPKFNVSDSTTEELVEYLKALGYQKLVPQSLCRPLVILLDEQIRKKIL